MKRSRADAGFTLAGLICVMTAVVVTSAVMVPYHVMESRREREKELIFRGEEYVRAIRKYQRKYQSYPAAIDDLLTRDGYRFLRKQYKDPISGEDFRFINVNNDGTLTGSVTMLSLPVATQPGTGVPNLGPGNIGGTPGQLPTAGGQNSGGQGGQGNSNNTGISAPGGSMASGTNSGINGVGNPFASGGGQNNTGRPQGVGTGVGSGVGTGGAFGGGSFGGGALGIGGSPVGIGSTGGGNPQNPNNANTSGTPGAIGGGGTTGPGAPSAIGNNPFTGGGATAQITPGLAGVGSQSTGTSVMVYNTKDKYNEWEFISPREQPAGVPNGQSGPNAQGGQNGQNGQRPPGAGPNANPFGGGGNPLSGGTNPFGGGGSPLGGGFGGGNPLGGGGTNQGRPSGPVGVGGRP